MAHVRPVSDPGQLRRVALTLVVFQEYPSIISVSPTLAPTARDADD